MSYMCRTRVLEGTSYRLFNNIIFQKLLVSISVLSRSEHTDNMNKYESTKALLQDFVHNTCMKIRGHKSGNLLKKITNNMVNTIFSQSLQIKQIEKGVTNIFLY